MAFLALSGCRKGSGYTAPENLLSIYNQSEDVVVGSEMKISQMSPSDVIVSVNAASLTKEKYERVLLAKASALAKRKGMTSVVADKMLDQFSRQYIKDFVTQRILVDEAIRSGELSEEIAVKYVGDSLDEIARSRKTSVQKIIAEYKGFEELFLYEIAVSFIMERFIATHIPPATEVTPEFIESVKRQVAEENLASVATNEFRKSRIQGYYQDIRSGKMDFMAAVRQVDRTIDKNDDGVWGEFELADFEDTKFATQVFSLPVGGISVPLEDEDGYHIIKVLSASPEEKDSNGQIVRRERRNLAHVFLPKEPLLIEESDFELSADLRNQMKVRAVSDFVSKAITNGINKVVYPHGRKLF